MSLMSWTPALSVGRADLDEQHRQLIDTVSQLSAASDRAQIGTLLETLMDLVMNHFVAEESLLEARSYPGLEAHRSLHNTHMTELMDLMAQHDDGHDIHARAGTVLAGWVEAHLTQTHAAFAPFLGA